MLKDPAYAGLFVFSQYASLQSGLLPGSSVWLEQVSWRQMEVLSYGLAGEVGQETVVDGSGAVIALAGGLKLFLQISNSQLEFPVAHVGV